MVDGLAHLVRLFDPLSDGAKCFLGKGASVIKRSCFARRRREGRAEEARFLATRSRV